MTLLISENMFCTTLILTGRYTSIVKEALLVNIEKFNGEFGFTRARRGKGEGPYSVCLYLNPWSIKLQVEQGFFSHFSS